MLAVLTALAAALVLGEAVVRLIRPEVSYIYRPQRIRADFYADSPHTEFTLRPDYRGRHVSSGVPFDARLTTNSLGWRDTEPDDRPRILVFGDSFTFGYGLDDGATIPDVLERLAGGGTDFVNLGCAAGRAPDSYAVYLRHHPELHALPALVLVFGNDLRDIGKNKYVDGAGNEVAFAACAKVSSDYIVIRDGSRLELVSPEDFVRRRLPVPLLAAMKRSYLLGLARDRLAAARRSGDDRPASAPGAPAGGDSPGSAASDLLLEALEEIRSLSSRLALITLGEMEFYAPVERFARERGLPYVSVPLFDDRHRFPGDGHYNARGAARAAALIHGALAAQGFFEVPGTAPAAAHESGGPIEVL